MKEPQLAAGTIFEYSLDLQTPAFIEVEGITNIGSIGNVSEPKDRTLLKDKQKKYGSSLKDATDRALKGQYWDNDAIQITFLDACRAETDMLIRITLPNPPSVNGTGTRFEFEYKPLGVEVDEPTAEEWLMFSVPGKTNSDPVRTAPVA